jgi:hypothetical protein
MNFAKGKNITKMCTIPLKSETATECVFMTLSGLSVGYVGPKILLQQG